MGMPLQPRRKLFPETADSSLKVMMCMVRAYCPLPAYDLGGELLSLGNDSYVWSVFRHRYDRSWCLLGG
jgi:hypothetical protein